MSNDDRGKDFNTFRDGKVHVMSEKCKTCIFRPGNLMYLSQGTVKRMVDDSIELNSAIICHSTLVDDRDNSVCRGFYDAHSQSTAPLRLAQQLNAIEFDSNADSE